MPRVPSEPVNSAGQVIACHALEGLVSGAHQRAVSQDNVQGQDRIAGDPVFRAAQATRVGGHVAAHGGDAVAGRIRRIHEPMLVGGRVEVSVDDAWFHHGQFVVGTDLQDPVHPFQAEHNAARRWRALRRRLRFLRHGGQPRCPCARPTAGFPAPPRPSVPRRRPAGSSAPGRGLGRCHTLSGSLLSYPFRCQAGSGTRSSSVSAVITGCYRTGPGLKNSMKGPPCSAFALRTLPDTHETRVAVQDHWPRGREAPGGLYRFGYPPSPVCVRLTRVSLSVTGTKLMRTSLGVCGFWAATQSKTSSESCTFEVTVAHRETCPSAPVSVRAPASNAGCVSSPNSVYSCGPPEVDVLDESVERLVQFAGHDPLEDDVSDGCSLPGRLGLLGVGKEGGVHLPSLAAAHPGG